MKFCRINLAETNYQKCSNAHIMSAAERDDKMDLLQSIYKKYCIYKDFNSVMPLFPAAVFDRYTDVFSYSVDGKTVAFSLVKRYDQFNAESLQFAWDYADPSLRLGAVSLEHECAYYKELGFKYLYLGEPAAYKQALAGYEELGKLHV